MSIPQRWPNTTHREHRVRALAQVILESSVRPTHLSRRTTVAPPMQNFWMCLQISLSAVEDDVSALHHVSAARKIKRQRRELLDQQHARHGQHCCSATGCSASCLTRLY